MSSGARRGPRDMSAPEVVSRDEWQVAAERLRSQEKALTAASDRLAAERRRMPAVEVGGRYRFAGPDGPVSLPDLFEGRRQLVLYSFMFPEGGSPCEGCSFFADQVGHLAHLHARDTSFALMSRAPLSELEAYRHRMGWDLPWYSLDGEEGFYAELGVGAGFALNVLLRDGDRVLHTYATSGRGVEALGTAWSFLDRTPMGRQESWEDAPAWVPQTPPYEWWRLHDAYDGRRIEAAA